MFFHSGPVFTTKRIFPKSVCVVVPSSIKTALSKLGGVAQFYFLVNRCWLMVDAVCAWYYQGAQSSSHTRTHTCCLLRAHRCSSIHTEEICPSVIWCWTRHSWRTWLWARKAGGLESCYPKMAPDRVPIRRWDLQWQWFPFEGVDNSYRLLVITSTFSLRVSILLTFQKSVREFEVTALIG